MINISSSSKIDEMKDGETSDKWVMKTHCAGTPVEGAALLLVHRVVQRDAPFY